MTVTNPKIGDSTCMIRFQRTVSGQDYCICVSLSDLQTVFQCVADCLAAFARTQGRTRRKTTSLTAKTTKGRATSKRKATAKRR